MEFFSIKNFERYQHYKDRNPPWIKLYYDLLDDEDFISLSIPSRHHYMTLLLVASRKHNKIPLDLDYLKKVMRLDAKPILTELFQRGFCVASKMLAECYHDASASVSVSVSELSSPEGEKIVKKRGNGKRGISDEDRPTDKHLAYAKGLGIEVGPEWGKFKNYCLAHDKRYANFEAAFRNWLANADTYKQKGAMK